MLTCKHGGCWVVDDGVRGIRVDQSSLCWGHVNVGCFESLAGGRHWRAAEIKDRRAPWTSGGGRQRTW